MRSFNRHDHPRRTDYCGQALPSLGLQKLQVLPERGDDAAWIWGEVDTRRSNQSILKEISPGCSLEGLMLKLKLYFFGHLVRVDSLVKTLMLGRIGGRR